jgi:hypothetical protein
MDKEYQTSRYKNEGSSSGFGNIGQNLVKVSFKNTLFNSLKLIILQFKNIFGGVTGLVTKPFEGAKEEGLQGLVKGVGKGLLGVITKPTGGIVDFTSQSFEELRK